MTDLEFFENESGVKAKSCSCEKCADMCKRSPCMGTPSDILKLIKAGYAQRLHCVTNVAGMVYGFGAIEMVMPKRNSVSGACTFLTADNLCELHNSGLKPMEGKLADCQLTKIPDGKKFAPAGLVALSWESPATVDLQLEVFKEMIKIEKE